jgi:hypothetical protein
MPLPLPSTVDGKPAIKLDMYKVDVSGSTLVYTKQKNVEMVDLFEQSLDIRTPQPFVNVYLVPDDTAMRIDIISQTAMGSVVQVEKMLKFNDISNPFSINTGDLLFVPDNIVSDSNMRVGTGTDARKKDIRAQYIDPSKASKLDPSLIDFDNREKPKKADPSKTSPPLPPNFANIGDKEIEIKGGKIVFGPNVSKNKDECEEPLTKSEFLSKLIKNRINRPVPGTLGEAAKSNTTQNRASE